MNIKIRLTKLEAKKTDESYIATECDTALLDYAQAVWHGEPITDELMGRVEKANAEHFSGGGTMTIQEMVAMPCSEKVRTLKEHGRL